MDYSFPQYLLSKQSVDDRALNKDVLSVLKNSLQEDPLTIIEIGGGIGTMLTRLLRWEVISRAEYTLVDKMNENIRFAGEWLPDWAKDNGFQVETKRENKLRLWNSQQDVTVKLLNLDIFEYIRQKPAPADLLIAHAFLDLLPLKESLEKILSLTKNLAWLTLNFDGVTSLEPSIDLELDAKIERLYHKSMDTRPGGGDSLSGLHLFKHLKQFGAEIEAVGASDWIVYPENGKYPAKEATFLSFILHFIEESLGNYPDLDKAVFRDWVNKRQDQINQAELVYIAHQVDFLVRLN